MAKKITKSNSYTCIEDVVIGYQIKIFNASEIYTSPQDNQLIDNSGKTRYVCSSWLDSFVEVENNLSEHKPADFEESLERWVDKVVEEDLKVGINWCPRDVSKIEMLKLDRDKCLNELQSALNLEESLNVQRKEHIKDINDMYGVSISDKQFESTSEAWIKYCEDYDRKESFTQYLNRSSELVQERDVKSNLWNKLYGNKEGVGYPPKPSKIIKYQSPRRSEDSVFKNTEPRNKKTEGQKNDSEKLPYYTVLFEQFPLALKEVIKCSKAGHQKYKETDFDMQNFSRVQNGQTRYKDAMLRHMTESGQVQDMVEFGEMTHEGAVVWNALADLELKLRLEKDS